MSVSIGDRQIRAYRRILRAAERGHGIRLSAEEVDAISYDDAIRKAVESYFEETDAEWSDWMERSELADFLGVSPERVAQVSKRPHHRANGFEVERRKREPGEPKKAGNTKHYYRARYDPT